MKVKTHQMQTRQQRSTDTQQARHGLATTRRFKAKPKRTTKIKSKEVLKSISNCTFLTIPPEIRLIIYDKLMEDAADILSNIEQRTPTSVYLNILLTCRTIYEEARLIAFRNAAFILDLRWRPSRSTITHLTIGYIKRHRHCCFTEFPISSIQANNLSPNLCGSPKSSYRLSDTILSLRPEHRDAISKVTVLTSACSMQVIPMTDSEGYLGTNSERSSLLVLSCLLPKLRSVIVALSSGPGGTQGFIFSPFKVFDEKYCIRLYGSPFAQQWGSLTESVVGLEISTILKRLRQSYDSKKMETLDNTVWLKIPYERSKYPFKIDLSGESTSIFQWFLLNLDRKQVTLSYELYPNSIQPLQRGLENTKSWLVKSDLQDRHIEFRFCSIQNLGPIRRLDEVTPVIIDFKRKVSKEVQLSADLSPWKEARAWKRSYE